MLFWSVGGHFMRVFPCKTFNYVYVLERDGEIMHVVPRKACQLGRRVWHNFESEQQYYCHDVISLLSIESHYEIIFLEVFYRERKCKSLKQHFLPNSAKHYRDKHCWASCTKTELTSICQSVTNKVSQEQDLFVFHTKPHSITPTLEGVKKSERNK